jgi:hypothetical protein
MSVTVGKIDGETSEMQICKYSDTVHDLKKKVTRWVCNVGDRFDLIHGDRLLDCCKTLGQSMVPDGARLTAVVCDIKASGIIRMRDG